MCESVRVCVFCFVLFFFVALCVEMAVRAWVGRCGGGPYSLPPSSGYHDSRGKKSTRCE